MREIKLFEILRSLSAWEIRRLGNYLQSPYINSNAQVFLLYRLLSQHHPHYNNEEASNNKILFQKLFPKKRYEDKKIRYLFTDYTRLLENFLVDESLQHNEPLHEQLLRKELALRNCGKSYRAKLNNKISNASKDADYFLDQYQSAYIHLDLWSGRQKRKEEQNIEEVIENLDKFYFAKKMELSCAVQNSRNVLARNFRNTFQDELMNLLHSHDYNKVPIIAIYYKILLTLTKENDEKQFDELLKLLLQHETNFSLHQMREIYQYAMNYCIKKINKGNTSYFKTLFQIYKVILPKKILMPEGNLPQFDYKNIVTIALRMKEIQWAKKFIEDYQQYINKEDRENAYTYNLAHWHFHNRDYSKTLSLFQRVKFTDVYYQLDTKSIQLKTYFEQDDLEAFFYHASAFRTYIRRNKMISDYQRLSYRNFIKYAGQLLRAGNAPKKISAIRKEMVAIKQVADINWLLQKADES